MALHMRSCQYNGPSPVCEGPELGPNLVHLGLGLGGPQSGMQRAGAMRSNAVYTGLGRQIAHKSGMGPELGLQPQSSRSGPSLMCAESGPRSSSGK